MSKSKTKRCPACGAQVDVEQQHCPNCPHSFFHEDGVQEYRKGRSKQHYFWVVAAVLFFVVAYKALNFVMKFADADDRDYSPIRQAAEQLSSTATVKTAGAPGAAGAADSEEQRARAEVQRALSHGRVQVVKADEAPAPFEGAKPAASAADEAAPSGSSSPTDSEAVTLIGAGGATATERPAKEWRLRGCVYDLVTLKPVPHATLVIKDAELNRRFELVTGPDGRYRTTVPPLPDRGYAVAVEHADYAPTYLDPGTNARRKTESERRHIAQELTHVLDAPYSIEGGRKPVVTDFYLAPLK